MGSRSLELSKGEGGGGDGGGGGGGGGGGSSVRSYPRSFVSYRWFVGSFFFFFLL